MKEKSIIIYCDGLCEPVNPNGVATYGYVIYRDKEKLAESCNVIDHTNTSNNVAEYTACIRALEYLIEMNLTMNVTVRSDSQLLIYQLDGYYSVNAPRIIPLYGAVKKLVKRFKRVSFQWVSREQNEEADALSRKAYVEYVEKNLNTFLGKYQPYLASEKQKAFMNRLKIEYPLWISKREASNLISQKLHGQRKTNSA
jgi:ribonuclease HI